MMTTYNDDPFVKFERPRKKKKNLQWLLKTSMIFIHTSVFKVNRFDIRIYILIIFILQSEPICEELYKFINIICRISKRNSLVFDLTIINMFRKKLLLQSHLHMQFIQSEPICEELYNFINPICRISKVNSSLSYSKH